MPDDKDPILSADEVQAQMRAAIERIRKRFNQALDEELERSDAVNQRRMGAN